MNTLTQKRLKELLAYDRKTGVFTWRVKRQNRGPGHVAGTPNRKYLVIRIDGRVYLAHRLAWMYVHGHWPLVTLDHRDGDGVNNRIANLREATYSENAQNQAQPSRNSSGVIGTTRVGGRWRAQISVAGRYNYLGTFDTSEEAQAAYLAAKARLHTFQPACR